MTRVESRHRRGRFAPIALSILVVAAIGLTGCQRGADPTIATGSAAPSAAGPTIERDIVYRDSGGEELALDVCTPPVEEGTTPSPLPAVILLHGGGFTQGSRNDEGIQNLCVWLAENGYIGVPVSYRLAAATVFPAQLEDVQAAVTWLRDPAQAARFGIDPARIGVLGSSAGAILAMSMGTFGEGPLTEGSRVGAVVSLSGVSTMTADALELGEPTPESASMLLTYLGCETVAECPVSVDASPITHVAAGDSPGLFLASDNELVPYQQSQVLADALTAVGVPATAIVDPGTSHGLPLMTGTNRALVLEFLDTYL